MDLRAKYEAGDDTPVPEWAYRIAENELRSTIAENMYAQGYAMGPVGRVLDALKEEQRAERRRRKLEEEGT